MYLDGVLVGVLYPLRFARLPCDHRYCIRRGTRVLGREDVVKDREAAGPLPEKRNGVAVDVRHDQARELRSLGFGTWEEGEVDDA